MHKPYLDMILAGTKTVESRLSRRRHPAATRCQPGDVVYLKRRWWGG
ncbi:MAG: ASCH domain-containing protein [Chloroflexi bacterium]|nr:ASCH domain-containing protein [Chloroflexota bacterium]